MDAGCRPMLTVTITHRDALVLTGAQGLKIVIVVDDGRRVSVTAPPDIKIHCEPRKFAPKGRAR